MCVGDEGVFDGADQTTGRRLLHPGAVPGGGPLGPHQADAGRVSPQGALRGCAGHMAYSHCQPEKPRQGHLRVSRVQDPHPCR